MCFQAGQGIQYLSILPQPLAGLQRLTAYGRHTRGQQFESIKPESEFTKDYFIYIYYVLLLLVVDFSIDNCDKMTIDVEGSVVNHTLILTINYCHCHCQILLSQEGLVSETPS